VLLLLASLTYLISFSHLIYQTKGGEFARRHVPVNLRQLLAAESAANDGLAYPFLTLALYLTIDSSRGVAISHWVLIGCLCMSSFYLVKDFFFNMPSQQIKYVLVP
jgi:hypothetical protein